MVVVARGVQNSCSKLFLHAVLKYDVIVKGRARLNSGQLRRGQRLAVDLEQGKGSGVVGSTRCSAERVVRVCPSCVALSAEA